MLDFGFYNRDCMEGMKEFPDKYFDLAIVDPPYGGGASQNVHVEREREDCMEASQTMRAENDPVSADGLTATISAARTGGGWTKRFQRERPGRRAQICAIGTSHLRRNISTNWREFPKCRLYGAGIISTYRLHDAF